MILHDNTFTFKGMIDAAIISNITDISNKNPNINSVSIDASDSHPQSEPGQITKALPSHTLFSLTLQNFSILSKEKFLEKVIKSNLNLRYLNLSKNFIDDEMVNRICLSIKSHPSLVCLDLSLNNISEKGAKHISNTLPETKLYSLFINNNQINERGLFSILDSIKYSSLISLSLSDNYGINGIHLIIQDALGMDIDQKHIQRKYNAKQLLWCSFFNGSPETNDFLNNKRQKLREQLLNADIDNTQISKELVLLCYFIKSDKSIYQELGIDEKIEDVALHNANALINKWISNANNFTTVPKEIWSSIISYTGNINQQLKVIHTLNCINKRA